MRRVNAKRLRLMAELRGKREVLYRTADGLEVRLMVERGREAPDRFRVAVDGVEQDAERVSVGE